MTDATTGTGYAVKQLKNCRHCGSPDMLPFLNLPDMPLTDAFEKSASGGSEFLHAIQVYLCQACGLNQTQHDVHVEQYYADYRYTTGGSNFVQTFMRRTAEEVWKRWDLKEGDSVIEIGSGDGAQLVHFKNLGARVLGFEPSEPLAKVSRDVGVPVVMGLYQPGSESLIPEDMRPAQVVLLTYTFDHLPQPTVFARTILPALDPERGLLLIEVHNFQRIFERREFCLLEHEHSVYPTAATLQMILDDAGFDVIELELLPEKERRANSLLAIATPKGSKFSATQKVVPLDKGIYADPKQLLAFGKNVEASIGKLKAYVADRKARGVRVAGYGAGGRGVMTLAAMAKPGEIAYVCDQNPAFHGLFTPGARVPVVAPSHLMEDPVDELVVFSFGYFQEIWDLLPEFRAGGGKIISMLDLL